jgi:O-antigen ligase
VATTTGRDSSRVSFVLLSTTIALVPLPFGSNDPPYIAVWCIVLGTALAFVNPRPLRAVHLLLLGLCAIVAMAYAFVLHEQLAEHPWTDVPPHEVWDAAARLLDHPIAPSVSIARNQPWFSLGPPLAAVSALACSFILCADRERARTLLDVIAWCGAAYAVFAISAFLIDPNKVLWRDKAQYQGYLTGTFMNRNTAAAYFGMCATVWLLLVAEKVRALAPRDRVVWSTLAADLMRKPSRQLLLRFSMLFVCVAAMSLTGSRAGMVLSLGAMIAAFWAFFRRDIPRGRGALIGAGIALTVVIVILQVLGAGVSSRLGSEGAADGGRRIAYVLTSRMAEDHPWLGTGLGTFVWSFPAYRSADLPISGIWDRAHDTWLELASDLGIPLAGVIIVGWLVMVLVLFHGIRHRRRDLILPAGALSVALLAVAHSSVDFSLQTPGFAIVAMALIGAGLAQSFRSRSSEKTSNGRVRQSKSSSGRSAAVD